MNKQQLRDFTKYLTAHGADVLATTNEYELIRFSTDQGIGVIYQNKHGDISSFVNGAGEAYKAWCGQDNSWRGTPKKGKRVKNPDKRQRLLERLKQRDGLNCPYCGDPIPAGDITVEHVVALTSGGASVLANMTLACSACNNRVGAMTARQKIEYAVKMRAKRCASSKK